MRQLDEKFLLKLGSASNYLKRLDGQEDSRTQMLAKRAFLHRPLMNYTEYMNHESGVVDYSPELLFLIDIIDTEIASLNDHREKNLCDYEFIKLSLKKIEDVFRNQNLPMSPEVRKNQDSL